MDELKLLISMVKDLPALATWVLVGYLIYKISVIGSIYGVIRLLIVKTHDVMLAKKISIPAGDLGCINDDVRNALLIQLRRIRVSTGAYVHDSDVQRLAKAIDKMLEPKP